MIGSILITLPCCFAAAGLLNLRNQLSLMQQYIAGAQQTFPAWSPASGASPLMLQQQSQQQGSAMQTHQHQQKSVHFAQHQHQHQQRDLPQQRRRRDGLQEQQQQAPWPQHLPHTQARAPAPHPAHQHQKQQHQHQQPKQAQHGQQAALKQEPQDPRLLGWTTHALKQHGHVSAQPEAAEQQDGHRQHRHKLSAAPDTGTGNPQQQRRRRRHGGVEGRHGVEAAAGSSLQAGSPDSTTARPEVSGDGLDAAGARPIGPSKSPSMGSMPGAQGVSVARDGGAFQPCKPTPGSLLADLGSEKAPAPPTGDLSLSAGIPQLPASFLCGSRDVGDEGGGADLQPAAESVQQPDSPEPPVLAGSGLPPRPRHFAAAAPPAAPSILALPYNATASAQVQGSAAAGGSAQVAVAPDSAEVGAGTGLAVIGDTAAGSQQQQALLQQWQAAAASAFGLQPLTNIVNQGLAMQLAAAAFSGASQGKGQGSTSGTAQPSSPESRPCLDLLLCLCFAVWLHIGMCAQSVHAPTAGNPTPLASHLLTSLLACPRCCMQA